MGLLVSGQNPAAIKTAERNIFTATAGQTSFTITQGYQPGDIDVYLNGIRLVDTEDYIALNGSTVVLNEAATVGDSVVVVCFYPFSVASHYTKSESDTRYVNAGGDTMSGNLGIGAAPSAPLTIGRVSSTNEGGQIDLCRSTDNASAWGIDVYGDTSTPSLRILDNIAAAVRLQIDGSGRVTTPNQPAFFARGRNSTFTAISTYYTPINFSSVDLNRGSHWNNTTATFTAPVSGDYLTMFTVGNQGSENNGQYIGIYILRNDVSYMAAWSLNTGYDSTAHCGGVIPLSAGDTIKFTYYNSYGTPPTSTQFTQATCYLLG